jgi:hypothetical protein
MPGTRHYKPTRAAVLAAAAASAGGLKAMGSSTAANAWRGGTANYTLASSTARAATDDGALDPELARMASLVSRSARVIPDGSPSAAASPTTSPAGSTQQHHYRAASVTHRPHSKTGPRRKAPRPVAYGQANAAASLASLDLASSSSLNRPDSKAAVASSSLTGIPKEASGSPIEAASLPSPLKPSDAASPLLATVIEGDAEAENGQRDDRRNSEPAESNHAALVDNQAETNGLMFSNNVPPAPEASASSLARQHRPSTARTMASNADRIRSWSSTTAVSQALDASTNTTAGDRPAPSTINRVSETAAKMCADYEPPALAEDISYGIVMSYGLKKPDAAEGVDDSKIAEYLRNRRE